MCVEVQMSCMWGVQMSCMCLTVGYEYRKGFDVVLAMQNLVGETGREVIENASIKEE